MKWLLFAIAVSLAAGVHAQTATKAAPAKPAPKTAAKAPQKPAAQEDSDGVKAVEHIFACVAKGLPEGWRRAWVVVTELTGDDKERTFEGKFHYSLDAAGGNPLALVPCDAREVAERIYALNDFLEYEKRQWKIATLIFTRDGKFELKYDYSK